MLCSDAALGTRPGRTGSVYASESDSSGVRPQLAGPYR